MQTEVPTLPVVHFNAHKNLNRKQNSNLGGPSVETKAYSSNKNIAYLSSKKKNLHPLLGQPYQNNVRRYLSSEQSNLNKNNIEQRVLSAKMLHIKELQNQLADAHYQLNELTNENKLLKALQKRQDSALKRYEGRNAELPRIINSHHEELRVLQIKYKKLKALQKDTCNLLKEKENELQQLQSQNKHLLQLSKDRSLGEREKLQLQVSDLNHRIQQQQDTIQTLHRKLTLEAKSLKQQLHLEISKRKETQKHLDETIEKLKTLENLLDNRERRLYYNGQLFSDKHRRFGTQSLTNLRDISSSNLLKLSDKNKKWQTNGQENSLPMLHSSDLHNKNSKIHERINSSQTLDCTKTETMINLEQVRKYRLQKSPYKKILDDTKVEPNELDFEMNKTSEISMVVENLQLEKQDENAQKYKINTDKFRKMYKNKKCQNFNELIQKGLDYLSGGSESESENFKNNYTNATDNSKQLHTRLNSSADDTSDSKELTLSDCKYEDKLKVLVRERTNSYESDSEIESEISKQAVENYLTMNHQNDTFKLISSVYDSQTQYDKGKEKLISSSENILNASQKLYQNLINEMHVQTENVERENVCAQYNVNNIQTECGTLEDLENYMFEQEAVFKTQEYNEVHITKKKPESLLQTHSKSEISHTIKIPFNDSEIKSSMKDVSNSSKNLDKEIINIANTPEIEIINKNILLENCNLETKNKLNKQELNKQLGSVDMFVHTVQSLDNDSVHNILADINTTNEISTKTKMTNYDKEKLLASMKAIDDNENIEFLKQDYEKHNVTSRKQITENVFHDLPAHIKKKQDIIKDIFDTNVIKIESSDSCHKLH